MRKLSLGLSFAAMAVLVACGDDNSSIANDLDELSSSSENDVNDVVTGTFTDPRDGQTYRTVKIGNQTWMAENLNYRYLGPTDDLDSSSFCYDDDPANCDTYGRLYLWSAAMDSAGIIEGNTANGCGYNSECSPSGNVRGVCPQDWHLPSNWDEFETLFEAVGGQEVAGAMLKSTSGWNSNGDGTDAYGFSAFPAGYRNVDSGFHNLGNNVTFWSSTEIGGGVYSMYLNYSYERAFLEDGGKDFALSVRCLKD
ncbi:fibrobacter succinogenes major paralogous domain-containing protein [Fibrobacter sp.]|uniref:fibrobacter succinogenes major paralogous domain-containing protein n=1 Tax=Fibrobacter sp. TaxID=35828 RepID=UPI00388CFB79